MPAAWQASGTLLGSTGADITPVIPTHAADDILILMAASRVGTDTLLTPSGWTLYGGPVDLVGWRAYVYWKRAAGGAETNPLCDWTGTGEKYGQVHTVRGAVTSGDPFTTSLGLWTDGTDPIIVPGVTTTAANQLVIVVGLGNDNASASVTVTSTDPASYTQRHFSTIITGADATGSFHTATRATAGATGNVTLDHNSTMPLEVVLVVGVLDPVADNPFPYIGGGYYGG